MISDVTKYERASKRRYNDSSDGFDSLPKIPFPQIEKETSRVDLRSRAYSDLTELEQNHLPNNTNEESQLELEEALEKGQLLFSLESPKEEFDSISESEPMSVESQACRVKYFIEQGTIFSSENNYQSALNCWASAAALNPDSFLPYLLAGTLLSDLSFYAEASHFFHNALLKDPASIDSYLGLATASLELGNEELALQCMRRAQGLI